MWGCTIGWKHVSHLSPLLCLCHGCRKSCRSVSGWNALPRLLSWVREEMPTHSQNLLIQVKKIKYKFAYLPCDSNPLQNWTGSFLAHALTKFHEDWASSFSVILLTNRPKKIDWKNNLFGKLLITFQLLCHKEDRMLPPISIFNKCYFKVRTGRYMHDSSKWLIPLSTHQ